MPVRDGTTLLVRVETAPGVFTAVEDLTSYSNGRTRDVTRVPVFARLVPHTRRGAKEESFTLGGILNDDDPGQQALREAEDTDTPITIEVVDSETGTGFRQLVRPNSYTHEADPDGFQEITFELVAEESPVAVGEGSEPLLAQEFQAFYEWRWIEALTTGRDFAIAGGIVVGGAGLGDHFEYQPGTTLPLPASSECLIYKTVRGNPAFVSKAVGAVADLLLPLGAEPLHRAITTADAVIDVQDLRVPLYWSPTPRPFAPANSTRLSSHGFADGMANATAALTAAIAAMVAAGQTRLVFDGDLVRFPDQAWAAAVPDGTTIYCVPRTEGLWQTEIRVDVLNAQDSVFRLVGKSDIELWHAKLVGPTDVSVSKGFGAAGCTRCVTRHCVTPKLFGWGTFLGLNGAVRSTHCGQDGCITWGTHDAVGNGHGTEMNATDFCFMERGYTVDASGNGVETYHAVDATYKTRKNRISNCVFELGDQNGIGNIGSTELLVEFVHCLNPGKYGVHDTASEVTASFWSVGNKYRHVLVSGSGRNGGADALSGSFFWNADDMHAYKCISWRSNAEAFRFGQMRRCWLDACEAHFPDEGYMYAQADADGVTVSGFRGESGAVAVSGTLAMVSTEGRMSLFDSVLEDLRAAPRFANGIVTVGALPVTEWRRIEGLDVQNLKFINAAANAITRDVEGVPDQN